MRGAAKNCLAVDVLGDQLTRQLRTVLKKLPVYLVPRPFMYLVLSARANRHSFAGMVRGRLAYDRREVLVSLVDKVAAREYCREKSKTIQLPRLFQVVESSHQLEPSLWPEECVIKPSFGSGAIVMVTTDKKPELQYSINPNKFRWDQGYQGLLRDQIDIESLRLLCNKWLETSYEYWTLKYPEWAYRHVPRRVIVEEIVQNLDGSPPTELRLHCFHGKVALIRVTDVVRGGIAWSFGRDGKPIQARLQNESQVNLGESPLPPNWESAVMEAELISQDIDYVRVDLYLTDHGVFFSELTPYPNGGFLDFEPREVSRWLADLWKSGPVAVKDNCR